MIGILLVTHDRLGDSLVDCVQHVMGYAPSNLKALSVLAEDNLQSKEDEGRALIAQLDTGSGVLLLADLFGSTPSNIAQRLSRPGRVEGVAGVNLPMLLRAVCYCDRPLDEVMHKAMQGGRECIILMGEGNGHDAATRCPDH